MYSLCQISKNKIHMPPYVIQLFRALSFAVLTLWLYHLIYVLVAP